MAEHALLGIDTIGHARVQWMGVHSVFLFFLLSVWMGVHAPNSLKKGQCMSATRLGIVSGTAKILLLLPAYFLFLRVHFVFTQ